MKWSRFLDRLPVISIDWPLDRRHSHDSESYFRNFLALLRRQETGPFYPMKVCVRPLRLDDAETSWRWRNDDEVWRFTGKRPTCQITADIERQWINAVLQETNSRRFAIIVSEHGNETYVGNVQITDIAEGIGSMHVFIGNRRYWGKGIASQACASMLAYAFSRCGLEKVRLKVHPDNRAAIRVYQKLGFISVATGPGFPCL